MGVYVGVATNTTHDLSAGSNPHNPARNHEIVLLLIIEVIMVHSFYGIILHFRDTYVVLNH